MNYHSLQLKEKFKFALEFEKVMNFSENDNFILPLYQQQNLHFEDDLILESTNHII